jgi:hypothetical protein
MNIYKLHIDALSLKQNAVLRLSDNAYIPFAVDNADYQAYLKWVAEGNEPLPADEVTE